MRVPACGLLPLFLGVLSGEAMAQEAAPPPTAPPPSVRDKLFFGGGVGLSFGEVDYVEIAPLIGYRFHPKMDGGIQLIYRYRNDSRYPDDLSTSDYGANVFGRYFVKPNIFLQGEYEYLNYEFVRADLSTGRDNFGSVLAGGGFHQPMGRTAGFYFSALYNFSYNDNDLYSPYSDPWVIQVGVTAGF